MIEFIKNFGSMLAMFLILGAMLFVILVMAYLGSILLGEPGLILGGIVGISLIYAIFKSI